MTICGTFHIVRGLLPLGLVVLWVQGRGQVYFQGQMGTIVTPNRYVGFQVRTMTIVFVVFGGLERLVFPTSNRQRGQHAHFPLKRYFGRATRTFTFGQFMGVNKNCI